MIDAALPQLPLIVPPTSAVDPSIPGGPSFAILLAQRMPASEPPDGVPLNPPPVAVTMPLPATVPFPDAVEPEPRGVEVVDHADRFDARGVLDANALDAAPGEDVATVRPRFAAVGDAVPVGALPSAGEAALPAQMQGVLRSSDVKSPMLPVRGGDIAIDQPPPAAPLIATMPQPQRVTEREVAFPVVARPRTRPAFRATQAAPQIAVAALADGLAVAASVGALPQAERHRLRDAIASLLLRHGYHPRAVTLLAAPVPSRSVEFR